MFRPELGVSLHCLVDEVTEEVLQAVGGSRIATLEIWPGLFAGDQGAARKELLKATCRTGSVRVASVHAPFGAQHDFSRLDREGHERGIGTLMASIDLAVELDAPILVAHAGAERVDTSQGGSAAPATPRQHDRRDMLASGRAIGGAAVPGSRSSMAPRRGERLQQARRAFHRITRRCREARRRVAVELLPRTCLGNTVEEVLEILDGLDEGVFGVCMDVNHLMDRHARLADDIRTLGPRLVTTHLSDYDGVDEKHWLPGEGVIDWPSVMAALRDIDYAGPFNYECRPPDSRPGTGDALKEKIAALHRNFDWLTAL